MSDPKPDELRQADLPESPPKSLDLPKSHPAIQLLLLARDHVDTWQDGEWTAESSDNDEYLKSIDRYLKSQGHL